MQREDYPKLRDLLNQLIETGRPLQIKGREGWRDVREVERVDFSYPIDHYRVQPAPPQPKFRPMNHEELMNEVYKKAVVCGPTSAGYKAVGVMSFFNGNFEVSGTQMDTAMLRYADPSDPRCGQPLQVEIKDDPQ